jgi:hypothetical protein
MEAILSHIKNITCKGMYTFTEEITHPNGIRLLRKLVYGWFLVNTLILLPAASEFWGTDSLIPQIGSDLIKKYPLLHLLHISAVAPWYKLFIVFQVVLLVLGILCIYPRIVSTLIYLVTINLDNKAYVILDGGNNLLQIVLLYLILIDPSLNRNRYKSSTANYLNNALSNAGFYMVRLQLVMVYLVAGLAKVSGELWQNGTALYYTLNIDEYSHPLAKKIISHYPFISVLGSYATVIYQVSFPWLVWNRKIRPWLLAFGTFIHIQISFVMGLFMFGFAIAVTYFSFTTDNAAKKILNMPGYAFRFLTRLLKRYQ